MNRDSTTSLENIRHSLAHLLAMAVLKKFPKAKLGIGPIVENGFYYDFKLPTPIEESDLREFEQSMRELIRAKLPITGKKVTPAAAKKLFNGQPFKLDLIRDFTKEKKQLTVYTTGKKQVTKNKKQKANRMTNPYPLTPIPSSFTDLCRGGHVKNTDEINPDAFKLTTIAGAYWKGDEKNDQLTRIYGVAFATKQELEQYTKQLDEAHRRDHKRLGPRCP
jgi:threonyl-tRNA synthetase